MRREAFYRKHAHHWPGTLLDPFDLLSPLPIDELSLRQATGAGQAISAIYSRLMSLLQGADIPDLLELGLPNEAIEFFKVRTPNFDPPVIGRIDLALTPQGYKMLEFNFDAPGLLVECFSMNGFACRHESLPDVNELGEQKLFAGLAAAIRSKLSWINKSETDELNVAVCAEQTYVRDKDMAEYMAKHLSHAFKSPIEFVPKETLRSDHNGIFRDKGKRIDVLLVMFPLRYFCRDNVRMSGGNGFLDERMLSRLVGERKLIVINPLSSYFMHSKSMQTLIWELAEAGLHFDERERKSIRDLFLPTYDETYPVPEKHVRKPAFGSNGDSIAVVDPDAGLIAESRNRTYMDEPMVCQKYVALPSLELMTEHGMLRLEIVTSVFVVNGEPIGVMARAGRGITDNSWWFLPLGLSDTDRRQERGRLADMA